MSAPAVPSTAPAAATRSGLPPWASLGIIFGLVGAASIVLFGPIGVSSTYPRFVGEVARALDPAFAESNPYLVRMGALLRPETFLVVGLLIGGFLGARKDTVKAPKVENPHAGVETNTRRYTEAFLAGFLILFGSRLAGGCTSGLIISGMTQLSIAGFVFAAGVFATGIGTAKLMHAMRVGGN
ncbi:MAG: YeeE/YedE family protein [Gemmatimonadaceae bacterium]|nr:YeeE/YedE family protein [Gemmatimonadaceae bacterium]